MAEDNRLNDNKLKKEVVKTTKKDKAKEYETFLDIDETNIASSSKLKKKKHKDHEKSEKKDKKKKKKKHKLTRKNKKQKEILLYTHLPKVFGQF